MAADPFPAVMVESDGFLVVNRQLVVDHIQHFQKGHVGGYILGMIGIEPTLIFGPFWRHTFSVKLIVFVTCSSFA
jgi:hypothetical protein